MSRCKIISRNQEPLTLPRPLTGVLAPRSEAIVAYTVAQIVTLFGGATGCVAAGVAVEAAPDNAELTYHGESGGASLPPVVLGGNVATSGGFNSGGAGLTAVGGVVGTVVVEATDFPNAPLTAVASVTQLGGVRVQVNNGIGSVTVLISDNAGTPMDAPFGIIVFVNP